MPLSPTSEGARQPCKCGRLHARILTYGLNCTREVITLSINGQPKAFPGPLSVTNLIEVLDLGGKRCAVERNGEIVPRSQFEAIELTDGDVLEIVVAVGGG